MFRWIVYVLQSIGLITIHPQLCVDLVIDKIYPGDQCAIRITDNTRMILEIIESIQSGQYGTIFKVKNYHTFEIYAMKLGAEHHLLWESEIEITKKLSQQYVDNYKHLPTVKYIISDTNPWTKYFALVMEYLPLTDIFSWSYWMTTYQKDLIHPNRDQIVCKYFNDISFALKQMSHIFDNRILIDRDVKPENIFIRYSGNVIPTKWRYGPKTVVDLDTFNIDKLDFVKGDYGMVISEDTIKKSDNFSELFRGTLFSPLHTYIYSSITNNKNGSFLNKLMYTSNFGSLIAIDIIAMMDVGAELYDVFSGRRTLTAQRDQPSLKPIRLLPIKERITLYWPRYNRKRHEIIEKMENDSTLVVMFKEFNKMVMKTAETLGFVAINWQLFDELFSKCECPKNLHQQYLKRNLTISKTKLERNYMMFSVVDEN